MDLSILQFDLVNDVIYSNGYGHLTLALKVDIGGDYVLNPTSGTSQTHKTRLFISTDDTIDDTFDLQVKKQMTVHPIIHLYRFNKVHLYIHNLTIETHNVNIINFGV